MFINLLIISLQSPFKKILSFSIKSYRYEQEKCMILIKRELRNSKSRLVLMFLLLKYLVCIWKIGQYLLTTRASCHLSSEGSSQGKRLLESSPSFWFAESVVPIPLNFFLWDLHGPALVNWAYSLTVSFFSYLMEWRNTNLMVGNMKFLDLLKVAQCISNETDKVVWREN